MTHKKKAVAFTRTHQACVKTQEGEMEGNTLTTLPTLSPVFCYGGPLAKHNKTPEGKGAFDLAIQVSVPGTELGGKG